LTVDRLTAIAPRAFTSGLPEDLGSAVGALTRAPGRLAVAEAGAECGATAVGLARRRLGVGCLDGHPGFLSRQVGGRGDADLGVIPGEGPSRHRSSLHPARESSLLQALHPEGGPPWGADGRSTARSHE